MNEQLGPTTVFVMEIQKSVTSLRKLQCGPTGAQGSKVAGTKEGIMTGTWLAMTNGRRGITNRSRELEIRTRCVLKSPTHLQLGLLKLHISKFAVYNKQSLGVELKNCKPVWHRFIAYNSVIIIIVVTIMSIITKHNHNYES